MINDEFWNRSLDFIYEIMIANIGNEWISSVMCVHTSKDPRGIRETKAVL